MVSFPHCKINLGLHVLSRRSDGYHDLETVFYPLPLKDVLEIIPSTHSSAQTDPQRPELVADAAEAVWGYFIQNKGETAGLVPDKRRELLERSCRLK